MALGLSGSNGGITGDIHPYRVAQGGERSRQGGPGPVEVSYFVNNVCNLRCRHCYVGYARQDNPLTIDQWKGLFDALIGAGARTFGNVGKEPLLSWRETERLLMYFCTRRRQLPELRFGLVTNGTMLDDVLARELARIEPNYIDISLDGDERAHDSIRGHGAFARVVSNLAVAVKAGLSSRIFISCTLTSANADSVGGLAKVVYDLGIRNLLISPYVSLAENDPLRLPNDALRRWAQSLLDGKVVDYNHCSGMNVYFKSEFASTRPVMRALVEDHIIDLDRLLIDRYGVVFCKYEIGGNTVFFNYQERDDFPSRAIRISHDGYVSNCLSMFYADYPCRAIGNVRHRGILDILGDFSSTRPDLQCVGANR